jgi:hypothetical protein
VLSGTLGAASARVIVAAFGRLTGFTAQCAPS